MNQVEITRDRIRGPRLYDYRILEAEDVDGYQDAIMYLRNIESDEVQLIDPRKGDMVLFANGQIWHRVESVQGNRERITLGGFLSFNHEKDAVVYWS